MSGCRALRRSTWTGRVVDEGAARQALVYSGRTGQYPLTSEDGRQLAGDVPGEACPTTESDHLGKPAISARSVSTLGVLEILDRAHDRDVVEHLGPDLLGDDWDPKVAAANLTARPDRPIAEALLDQRVLAGIGNVYCNELCFRQRTSAHRAGERGHRPVPAGFPRPRYVVGQPLPLESLHHRRYADGPATVGLRASRTELPSLRDAHQLRRPR